MLPSPWIETMSPSEMFGRPSISVKIAGSTGNITNSDVSMNGQVVPFDGTVMIRSHTILTMIASGCPHDYTSLFSKLFCLQNTTSVVPIVRQEVTETFVSRGGPKTCLILRISLLLQLHDMEVMLNSNIGVSSVAPITTIPLIVRLSEDLAELPMYQMISPSAMDTENNDSDRPFGDWESIGGRLQRTNATDSFLDALIFLPRNSLLAFPTMRTGEIVLALPLETRDKWHNATVMIRGAADWSSLIPTMRIPIDAHPTSVTHTALASNDTVVQQSAQTAYWESATRMMALTKGWLDRAMDKLVRESIDAPTWVAPEQSSSVSPPDTASSVSSPDTEPKMGHMLRLSLSPEDTFPSTADTINQTNPNMKWLVQSNDMVARSILATQRGSSSNALNIVRLPPGVSDGTLPKTKKGWFGNYEEPKVNDTLFSRHIFNMQPVAQTVLALLGNETVNSIQDCARRVQQVAVKHGNDLTTVPKDLVMVCMNQWKPQAEEIFGSIQSSILGSLPHFVNFMRDFMSKNENLKPVNTPQVGRSLRGPNCSFFIATERIPLVHENIHGKKWHFQHIR